MTRRELRAMGTDVVMLLDADDTPGVRAALDDACSELERLEQVFSRFRDDSELSRLNRDGGGRMSADMARVVRRSLELREATGGWFDPAVGADVRDAGYEGSFADLPPVVPARPPRGTRGPVTVAGASLTIAPGVRIDLGAIAKGYAADAVCRLLSRRAPALVSAGGDVVAHGLRTGGPWPVGIVTPGGQAVAALTQGAIATSGVDRRRWVSTLGEAHHVIDPHTGRPSATDLVRVSVAAASGADADAVATAMLAAGSDRAGRMAVTLGVPALAVGADGTVTRWGDLA